MAPTPTRDGQVMSGLSPSPTENGAADVVGQMGLGKDIGAPGNQPGRVMARNPPPDKRASGESNDQAKAKSGHGTKVASSRPIQKASPLPKNTPRRSARIQNQVPFDGRLIIPDWMEDYRITTLTDDYGRVYPVPFPNAYG
ncbi:uncharacterized protein DNG_07474 [Cephalotrichum gorgonifer]|uniref:Uncharacterized protein n=1 Tax=Cephalotrichum gorgonifer TaxID=2041049 RepID=A0AAE8N3E1_9PEZI|nr:uncharacterized protein DNG_07474 [Cephalotrichum gorgonifer]